MNKGNIASFNKGARVTYGSHGICVVTGVTIEDVLGEKITLIHLLLGTGNIIKVAEPVAERDFKLVTAKSHLAEVLDILSRPAKAKSPNWFHTENKYASALGTNDAISLATLVRDLHPGDKPLGTELVQLYRTGLYQLVQLLEATEASDVATLLKQMSAASGLSFRIEDTRPTTYAARSRSKRTKSPTPLEEAMTMVRLPKARPVAALPRPAPAPKPLVEKPVVRKAPPATKPAMKPVAPVPVVVAKSAPEKLPLVAPEVTPPVQTQIATPQTLVPAPSPHMVVAPPPIVEPEPRAVVTPRAKQAEPPVVQQPVVVDESDLRLENQLLQQKLSTLEGENKALKLVAARVENLETQLQQTGDANLSLCNQLSTKDKEAAAVNRRRQQIDREQRERETYQVDRIKRLGELLGVLFGAGQLLAAALHEKMTALPAVQTAVGRSKGNESEDGDMKEVLRQARRIGSLRQRQIDILKRKLMTARTDLKAANRTIDMQAAKLANNDVTVLLQALITRKEEIDALSAIIKDANKEVRRLKILVGARDKTIKNLREKVLTSDQVRANIAVVRDELLQLILKRTEAVERLQAYIRELGGARTEVK